MEFLLTIAGAVALLIWGTHQVTQGVIKGFGPRLRAVLATGLSSASRAMGAGFGVTLALQSSTATAMMASSFTARGALALAPGYWLMLGANLGTATVARILALPIHLLAPVLLLISIVAHRNSKSTQWRFLADACFGLGLMLLSLRMLSGSLNGIETSELGSAILDSLASQPFLALFLGTIAAWLCHSSVAVVLLATAWGATGMLPPNVGLALVLGANLGGALGPVLGADSLAGRRLPIANLLVRAFGVAGGAVILGLTGFALPQWLSALSLVDAHLLFNAVLLVVAAPFANPMAKLLMRLLPDPPASEDSTAFRPSAESSDSPSMVLAEAQRAALRTADRYATALGALPVVLRGDSLALDALVRIDQLGDDVTKLGSAVRTWISEAAMKNEGWDANQRRRASEIEAFVLSLEHSADILAHQVCRPLRKRYKNEGALPKSLAEILVNATALCEKAHSKACAVLIERDDRLAHELIRMKREFRAMERNAVPHTGPSTALDPELDDSLRLPREVGRLISQSCAVAHELLEHLAEEKETST